MTTAIENKYAEVIQTNPWIGHPINGEGVCPDGIGHYQHYDGGASIYWNPQTGAHLIYGLIRAKYAAMGWERGPSGYPTTDELDAGSGHGRFNNFQNGTIIWKSGANEAFAVYGSIYGKWGEYQWDLGELGFPLTDESGTPDDIGRYNHFEGGSIYWTPQTGAHVVKGSIRNAWAAQGWEVSRLQYPTSDELVTEGTNGQGRHSLFEGGEIYWTSQGGSEIKLYPVRSTAINFKNLSAGKVDTSQIWVKFSSDGTWQFHSFLHDRSTFYGDGYAIGFVFEGDGHGATISGELGASFSGPATDNDKTIGGTDPWIEKFYHKATQTKIHVALHVEEDPLSALGSVVSALQKYGPPLIALVGAL